VETLEKKVARLERENAELEAENERCDDGWKS
jgi:cell division protein FtsB